MNIKALGLASIASIAAPTAFALDLDLAVAERTEVNLGVEVLNKHWSQGTIRHDDVTANVFGKMRWYDIGLKIDGFMALAGDDQSEPTVNSFETTEVTARLDYLLEIEDLFQFLPFVELSSFPNITGKAPFNWAGAEIWWLTPIEGIEIGGSAQYNLRDNRDDDLDDNHWLFEVGAREFWQDAPLDLQFWQVVDLASRSYHAATVGSDKQGITTINVGGKATLPLPYEEMWAFLRIEGHWYVSTEDRDALDLQERDNSEVIIGIGIEYRMGD